jgi:hypothetical protein
MAALAQQWEVGGSAGYAMNHDVKVNGSTAPGKAGFSPGAAFGAVLGNNGRWVGGEVRYTYRMGDLRVSSGSTRGDLGGDSQALHYDVLIHATPNESAIRPFGAVGGGIRYFRGTGAEQAFQPLTNLVVLTRANQLEPLISVGGGVKFRFSRRALFRIDFRDYATPTPDKLLVTRGSNLRGWTHDFVLLLGISATVDRR